MHKTQFFSDGECTRNDYIQMGGYRKQPHTKNSCNCNNSINDGLF